MSLLPYSLAMAELSGADPQIKCRAVAGHAQNMQNHSNLLADGRSARPG